MDANSLLFLIFLLEFVIVFLLIRRVGRVPRVFVLDYQRGVRFLSGAFSNVVGPGRYLGLNKNVQIQVMDMRPRQFVMECVAYRDAMRNDSFVSIGAELVVSDPYLAATKLKDQFADSLPTVRDTLRSIASRGIGDANWESRVRMSDEITAAVNAELGASGMQIANLEITEIWSRPVVGRISAGLN
ncbi:MAG TPA: SPFH domain-containing protein [Candidatus Acidoferrales bacterium]|nr:SPFH domain-containing protein [Candidatus Acidoferrales bacterium]